MGKNKRRQFPYHDEFHNVDVLCDSIEECDFFEWCVEAAKLGIIQDFEYQPSSIQLFDAVDYTAFNGKKRSLFREHKYSPDFSITFIPENAQVLCKEFKVPYQDINNKSFQVYLDVKGTFQRGDGGRSFSINQKWVYQKAGIYVVKVIPKDFFFVCGCPTNCFTTRKTNKKRKAFEQCKCISEIFNIIPIEAGNH